MAMMDSLFTQRALNGWPSGQRLQSRRRAAVRERQRLAAFERQRLDAERRVAEKALRRRRAWALKERQNHEQRRSDRRRKAELSKVSAIAASFIRDLRQADSARRLSSLLNMLIGSDLTSFRGRIMAEQLISHGLLPVLAQLGTATHRLQGWSAVTRLLRRSFDVLRKTFPRGIPAELAAKGQAAIHNGDADDEEDDGEEEEEEKQHEDVDAAEDSDEEDSSSSNTSNGRTPPAPAADDAEKSRADAPATDDHDNDDIDASLQSATAKLDELASKLDENDQQLAKLAHRVEMQQHSFAALLRSGSQSAGDDIAADASISMGTTTQSLEQTQRETSAAKGSIAQLNGANDKVQMLGVDQVVTGGIRDRDERLRVRQARKRLSARCAKATEEIMALHGVASSLLDEIRSEIKARESSSSSSSSFSSSEDEAAEEE